MEGEFCLLKGDEMCEEAVMAICCLTEGEESEQKCRRVTVRQFLVLRYDVGMPRKGVVNFFGLPIRTLSEGLRVILAYLGLKREAIFHLRAPKKGPLTHLFVILIFGPQFKAIVLCTSLLRAAHQEQPLKPRVNGGRCQPSIRFRFKAKEEDNTGGLQDGGEINSHNTPQGGGGFCEKNHNMAAIL